MKLTGFALAARFVAAEVRCGVVDLSAAASFARSERFTVFVVWATTDWFDVKWLESGTDTLILCASGFSAEEWSLFIDWVVEIGQQITRVFGWCNTGWVLLQKAVEDFVALGGSLDVGRVAVDLAGQGDWVVALVVEQVGNEGVHGLELLTWRLVVHQLGENLFRLALSLGGHLRGGDIAGNCFIIFIIVVLVASHSRQSVQN